MKDNSEARLKAFGIVFAFGALLVIIFSFLAPSTRRDQGEAPSEAADKDDKDGDKGKAAQAEPLSATAEAAPVPSPTPTVGAAEGP